MLELAAIKEVSGVPIWVFLAGSGLSGLGVGALGYFQRRKISPAQTQALRLSAEKAAVEIVESALTVAQLRITTLEKEVKGLTTQIEKLQTLVEHQRSERARYELQLNLALAFRAELEYQLFVLKQFAADHGLHSLPVVRAADARFIVELPDGKILYASEGVFRLLGYTPIQLVGQNLSVLVPIEFRDRHHDQQHEFAENPRVRQMANGLDLHIRRLDGSSCPVDISLHPTGDGHVVALVREILPADSVSHGSRSRKS